MMSLFFSEYLSEPLFILRRLMVEIAFFSPGQNIWQKVKEIKQNWTRPHASYILKQGAGWNNLDTNRTS